MRNCPCKNCEDRCPGCHSVCKRYADWKNEIAENKNRENCERDKERVVESFLYGWNKNKKGKSKK